MSNKLVPQIYRSVIDDVVASIKSEFDEYGVSEDVLAELQHKWETKVIASHVADFEPAAQAANPHPQHPPYPPHPMHAHPPHPIHQAHYATPHNPYAPQGPHAVQVPPPPPGPQIKSEPVESRHMLGSAPMPSPYGMPALPGPQIPARPPNGMSYPGYPTMPARPPSNVPTPQAPTARYTAQPQSAAQTQQRIPQVDGPSSSSSDSPSPPSSQGYAPRATHPSLPQPLQSAGSVSQPDDEEAINSDLDDSDSDNDETGDENAGADTDIVFCTYDRVARVKNKWKCILKEGMIHVNGKDYLFAKCTGEFEW